MELTEYVTPEDVIRVLKCGRSTAYAHLRRAAGRETGDRGLLRVPRDVWEAYARAQIPGGVRAAPPGPATIEPPGPATIEPPRLRLVASHGRRLEIRPTQPRARRSSAA